MNYVEISILKIMTLIGFVFIPYFAGYYSDKVNRKYPLILGDFFSLVSLICLFFITNKIIVMLLFLLLSLSIIIPYPSIVAIINENLKDDETGKFNGMIISSKMLGLIISSLISGYIFMMLGYKYAFLMLLVVFFISFILSFKLNDSGSGV